MNPEGSNELKASPGRQVKFQSHTNQDGAGELAQQSRLPAAPEETEWRSAPLSSGP